TRREEARAMSTEQNKEVARRYYESVLNDGDVGALDEMAVPEYQENDPLPGQGTGLQGLKDRVTILKSGLDPRFTSRTSSPKGTRSWCGGRTLAPTSANSWDAPNRQGLHHRRHRHPPDEGWQDGRPPDRGGQLP